MDASEVLSAVNDMKEERDMKNDTTHNTNNNNM